MTGAAQNFAQNAQSITQKSYVPFVYYANQVNISAIRIVSLLFSLVIYAIFSSPTPDNPGWAELAVALGLISAIGFPTVVLALKIDLSKPLFFTSGQVFLIFGLTVPLLMGAMLGNTPVLMIRDMIPFLFMLLPVLLFPLVLQRPDFPKFLHAGIVFIGVIFALRAVFDHLNFAIGFLSGIQNEELTYLANTPTVLFSGLFLLGVGCHKFISATKPADILRGGLSVALAVVIFLPVALTLQRASLGYAAFYMAVLAGLGVYYHPARSLAALAVILAAAVPFYGPLYDMAAGLFHVLGQKTTSFGMNMRFEEMAAAWREVSSSVPTLLFGTGWGGTFESPAVAGIRVNFTHSLLTSVLLKTGLAGLVLVLVYLAGLARLGLAFVRTNPVLALAIAGPVVIDVFLYAAFKSLDFGLVLLMIPAYFYSARHVASPP